LPNRHRGCCGEGIRSRRDAKPREHDIGVHPSTLSRTVDRLVAREWMERASAEVRRGMELFAAAAGEASPEDLLELGL
jgi:hypothetical protein